MPSLTIIRERMIEAFEEDVCAEPMSPPGKTWKNLWLFHAEVYLAGYGTYGPGKVLGFWKWPSKEVAEMKALDELRKFEEDGIYEIEWLKSVKVDDDGGYAED